MAVSPVRLQAVWPVFIMLAVSPSRATAQCHYTYQRIPPPSPGWNAVGMDLNELGHACVLLEGAGDAHRVGFWSPETGTYMLPFPPGIINMEVGGINDHDVICGQMNDSQREYGYLWDRATGLYTVIDLPPGVYRVEMNKINNAGQVAATLYAYTQPDIYAVTWHDGVFHPVAPELDAMQLSMARAINERGEVAGEAAINYWTDCRGYLAVDANPAWLPHPPSLTISQCRSMSNNGFFAGQGTTAPSGDPAFAYRGIIWTPNETYVISPPAGNRDAWISDINDSGRAVGRTYRRLWQGPPEYSFVWQNGVMTSIASLTPGFDSGHSISAINNQGQILAGGILTSGQQGWFVLSPVWIAGDLTGDCRVLVDDLVIVLSEFGRPYGSFPRGDVDGDGAVGLTDLAILLAHFGN